MMDRIRFLALALALALLAGCAAIEPEPEPEPAEEQAGTLEPGDAVRHEVDNRAVALLWDRAEAARRENRLVDAANALERALQLAPEDAVLWSRLAEIRLRQRDFVVAENLAAKSNALAGSERLLRYRNWLLIAEARRQRGDETGADEARTQAESLRNPG